jgi:hypothetical protein
MRRQWIGALVGVLAGGALAIGAVLIVSGRPEPKSMPGPRTAAIGSAAALAQGTPVEFVLLEPLHSGSTEPGETASIVVTKEVKDEVGRVLVPAGATAKVEVVRSREASVATSLVNQPARLEVRFLAMNIKGTKVQLSAGREAGDATLELTRDTSSRNEASAALKSLWEHPETQQFLTDLADRLNGEKLGEDFDDPDSRRIMKDVAQQLGLSAMKRAGAEGQSVGAVLAATERVSRGAYENMDAAEAMLALQALSELAHLANGVDRGLRGAFKGRNIKIPIGTRLTAYVAKSASLAR